MPGSFVTAQMPDGKTTQPIRSDGEYGLRTADVETRLLLERIAVAQEEQVELLQFILSKLGG